MRTWSGPHEDLVWFPMRNWSGPHEDLRALEAPLLPVDHGAVAAGLHQRALEAPLLPVDLVMEDQRMEAALLRA
ncbi:hypothetical protein EYF80_057501 [Liparis tanakae]|uniref:Uncharacterized protein n=1 Tax=Liparis tanakae TaxID=230148 RepID=A0A4Z2EU78_9TELE|nr:hypothetical protein EYF80_057501 [Liparis tanakae]